MSKLTTAAANIRATATGGLRTGLSAMRERTVAPVTIYIGAGPSHLTFDRAMARRRSLGQPYGATPAPVVATPAAAPAKAARKPKAVATGPKLVKLPKRGDVTTVARALCAKLAAGTTHAFKVVQSKIDINGGHAFNVFMRLAGQPRGKHVITLYRNSPTPGTIAPVN